MPTRVGRNRREIGNRDWIRQPKNRLALLRPIMVFSLCGCKVELAAYLAVQTGTIRVGRAWSGIDG